MDQEDDMKPVEGDQGRRRRPRNPAGTRADLLAAARRLLERDGVLSGLNLREVAVEAGVNRGQIYQYFGSRRSLLRAALSEMTERWHRARVFHEDRALPFSERRLAVFKEALDNVTFIKLEALLALDGDEAVDLFPWLKESRRDLTLDKLRGALPEGTDELAAHAATATTYLGYCVFRDALARALSVSPEELDRRIVPLVKQMIEGVADPGTRDLDPNPADEAEV